MAQNIIYSPWERTKGPWLCFLTTLLLFCLLRLSPFVSAFLTSLIKLTLWLKFSTDRRQAEDMGRGRGGRPQVEKAQSSSHWSPVIWPVSSCLFKVVRLQFQVLFFPYFSEANSENCGSSCPEYSLVIMYLTSPPGVLVSVRQLTGYGSEYYL